MTEALACIIIGIIGLLIGGKHLTRYDRLRKEGRETEGIVFDIESSNSYNENSNSTTYYPIVRFVTDKQDWITEKSEISGFYKPGDRVTVVYNPNNPRDFTIKS